LDFRTDDGLGHFHYHGYTPRGMVPELIEKQRVENGFYLTTGRTLAHYNNAAQTKASEKLNKRYDEDVLLVSEADAEAFPSERAVLRTEHGESAPLLVKVTDRVHPGTLFATFHHASSRINALFGDKRDELILTAAFKSVKVEAVPA
ncbi:MAG TPA: formate dehydrogenase, partial [Sulfuricurvum sp.]|nr:formate dehydrogenase [Sulfuricurvum sp.]